jgi:translocation and assembly module TamA
MLSLSFAAPCAQPANSRVEITGAGDLLPLLQDNLQIVQLTQAANVSAEELQRLLNITPQQIKELMATEGYFSAEVKATLEVGTQQHIAHLQITPGAVTQVSQFAIRISGALADAPDMSARLATMRQHWLLTPGQRFRQAQWDAAKQGLLQDLLMHDYPAAHIADSSAQIDPERHTASLHVTVDSGPAFTFGELNISGLQRYPRSMIAHLNTIHPGEAYSQDRLSELQARLLDTGYFRSAFATVNPDPAQARLAPIRLELTEMESKRLGIGLGFSTDSGARAQLKWLDRNFLARDWRLETIFRADRQTQLAEGDLYLQPLEQGLFLGSMQGWVPSVGLSFDHTRLTGEDLEKIRNSVRLSSPSKINERELALSFLADHSRIEGLEPVTRQALVASYSYVRRRLDQLVAPRSGNVLSMELSAGLGGVLNDSNIERVLLQGWLLQPLGKRWSTTLRAQAGEVFGARDLSVPEDLLFRTGGDQSVRGYGYGSLGVPRNGAIVGGTVMAVFSAELVYQITPVWGAAVFSDMGDAAASRSEFHLKHGSGIGARWRSPIGPVNIDIAHGQESGETRLHFSIGYGF